MQLILAGAPRTFCVDVLPTTTFSQLAEIPALKIDGRHSLWFQHRGRRCPEGSSLKAAGVEDGDFVHMHLRLRGGGGDGGATGAESRSSYLEMYMQKKPDKVNPAEEKLARWTTCKLSGESLEPPCVVDELGSLYNKEALVTALVSKTLPKALGHITSLKHVKDIKLTPSSVSGNDRGATAQDFQPRNDSRFQCPISGQPVNGQYRFCVLLPSGHIVSEKAVKQVPTAVQEYIDGKWEEARPLNGNQEEVEALWDKLIAVRAAKKGKKERQKPAAVQAPAVSVSEVKTEVVKMDRKSSSEDSPTNSTERKLHSALPEKAGIKRGVQDFGIRDDAQAKRMKAKDMAPANADKKVWASLFTSTHGKPTVETYSCRSTSGRGWM